MSVSATESLKTLITAMMMSQHYLPEFGEEESSRTSCYPGVVCSKVRK